MDKRTLETIIRKSRHKKRGAKVSILIEIDGETKTLHEWAKLFDLNYFTLLSRYHAGYVGRDLIKPVHKKLNNFL